MQTIRQQRVLRQYRPVEDFWLKSLMAGVGVVGVVVLVILVGIQAVG